MKKKFSALLIISAVLFVFINEDAAPQQDYKRLAKLHKISPSSEVIITSPNAAQMLNMGDKVFVIVDKKPIILNITFPMMTVAKCRLAAGYEGYLGRLYKGMQVYKYEQGIENRELADKDSKMEAEGTSVLDITTSHPAKIYYLKQDDWEKILKTFMESFGKTMPESSIVKDETRKAIMNHNPGGFQISLSDIAYAIGNANITSPGKVEKLTDGDYYVWVVGNNIVANKVVTLKKNSTEKVFFELGSKTISVDSNPQGAQIYIDDVPQNLTTPSNVPIPTNKNSFKLSVKLDGYYDASQFISIQDNPNQKFNFNLNQAANAYVSVTSSPSGAYVYANEKYMGVSPIKLKVNPGSSVEISVRKDGYQAKSQYTTVANNETKNLRFNLPAIKYTYTPSYTSGSGFTQKNSTTTVNYTMGYFDTTAGFGVPPEYFKYMFSLPNNNFYGGEITFLFGKWFGYYMGLSLAGVPAKGRSSYSINQFVFDFSFGIGFLPRFWRFYIFAGIGISYNIAFAPLDLGFGIEYRAQLGFMITQDVGINLGFRRNYAMYLLGDALASTGSKSSDLSLLGGTYISVGMSF
jgi:hypothetical protein